MTHVINPSAMCAIAGRQLGQLLGNPMGYVVILAFVVAAGLTIFLPDEYYARDISDLQPLFLIMPLLLIILLPALAMGSWASEREHGTEEQLLTFPMSVVDIMLGKYLGILSFFALAMVGGLFQVAMLAWVGDPDLGLIVAQFAAWFAMGAVFAAASMLASTLTAMPAVAFVLGAAMSGVLWMLAWLGDWLVPFYRGEIALGGLGQALVAIIILLSLAALRVVSQRLSKESLAGQSSVIVAAGLTLIGLFNTGVILNQTNAANVDVTAEGLNSLDRSSLTIIEDVALPVTLNVFVSEELPPDLDQKGQQVLSMVDILGRELSGLLTTNIYRPADAFDQAGQKATDFLIFSRAALSLMPSLVVNYVKSFFLRS